MNGEDVVARATVTPEDPYYGESYHVDYTQPIEVIEVSEDPPDDITFNVAVIFVLSMIVGLLVFGSLSRRWEA